MTTRLRPGVPRASLSSTEDTQGIKLILLMLSKKGVTAPAMPARQTVPPRTSLVAVRVRAFRIGVEVPNTFGEHAVGSGGRRAALRNFSNWNCFPGICFRWRTWRRQKRAHRFCPPLEWQRSLYTTSDATGAHNLCSRKILLKGHVTVARWSSILEF